MSVVHAKESISKLKVFGLIVMILSLICSAGIFGYFLYTDIMSQTIDWSNIPGDQFKVLMTLCAIFVGVSLVNIILVSMLRHRAKALGIIFIFRLLLVIVLILSIVLFLIQVLELVNISLVYFRDFVENNKDSVDFIKDLVDSVGNGIGKVLKEIQMIFDDYISKYFIEFSIATISFGVLAINFIFWLIGFVIKKK